MSAMWTTSTQLLWFLRSGGKYFLFVWSVAFKDESDSPEVAWFLPQILQNTCTTQKLWISNPSEQKCAFVWTILSGIAVSSYQFGSMLQPIFEPCAALLRGGFWFRESNPKKNRVLQFLQEVDQNPTTESLRMLCKVDSYIAKLRVAAVLEKTGSLQESECRWRNAWGRKQIRRYKKTRNCWKLCTVLHNSSLSASSFG